MRQALIHFSAQLHVPKQYQVADCLTGALPDLRNHVWVCLASRASRRKFSELSQVRVVKLSAFYASPEGSAIGAAGRCPGGGLWQDAGGRGFSVALRNTGDCSAGHSRFASRSWVRKHIVDGSWVFVLIMYTAQANFVHWAHSFLAACLLSRSAPPACNSRLWFCHLQADTFPFAELTSAQSAVKDLLLAACKPLPKQSDASSRPLRPLRHPHGWEPGQLACQQPEQLPLRPLPPLRPTRGAWRQRRSGSAAACSWLGPGPSPAGCRLPGPLLRAAAPPRTQGRPWPVSGAQGAQLRFWQKPISLAGQAGQLRGWAPTGPGTLSVLHHTGHPALGLAGTHCSGMDERLGALWGG